LEEVESPFRGREEEKAHILRHLVENAANPGNAAEKKGSELCGTGLVVVHVLEEVEEAFNGKGRVGQGVGSFADAGERVNVELWSARCSEARGESAAHLRCPLPVVGPWMVVEAGLSVFSSKAEGDLLLLASRRFRDFQECEDEASLVGGLPGNGAVPIGMRL
jgi:hypothetical protein